MVIEFIPAEEVKSGRGGKGDGVRYGGYTKAIAPLVPIIKEAIKKSKDGTIRIKNRDIAKEMGGDFPKKKHTSIYWGLKYSLFLQGIVVDTGTHRDRDKLLVMRMKIEGDKLPPSLIKGGRKSVSNNITSEDDILDIREKDVDLDKDVLEDIEDEDDETQEE